MQTPSDSDTCNCVFKGFLQKALTRGSTLLVVNVGRHNLPRFENQKRLHEVPDCQAHNMDWKSSLATPCITSFTKCYPFPASPSPSITFLAAKVVMAQVGLPAAKSYRPGPSTGPRTPILQSHVIPPPAGTSPVPSAVLPFLGSAPHSKFYIFFLKTYGFLSKAPRTVRSPVCFIGTSLRTPDWSSSVCRTCLAPPRKI